MEEVRVVDEGEEWLWLGIEWTSYIRRWGVSGRDRVWVEVEVMDMENGLRLRYWGESF